MFEGIRAAENWPLVGELDHKELSINEGIIIHLYLSDTLSAMGTFTHLALWGGYVKEYGNNDMSKTCSQRHFHKLTKIIFRSNSAM